MGACELTERDATGCALILSTELDIPAVHGVTASLETFLCTLTLWTNPFALARVQTGGSLLEAHR